MRCENVGPICLDQIMLILRLSSDGDHCVSHLIIAQSSMWPSSSSTTISMLNDRNGIIPDKHKF